MKRTWKIGFLSLALVALVGAGVASAHGGFGGWDGKAVEKNCSDDMTVGDCRDAIRDARQQEMLERCTEEYGEEFCTEAEALRAEQRAETEALLDEYGIEGPVRFQPERPAEPTPCSDDMTVAECRETHQEAARQARLDACSEEYGEEFCTAFADLQEEHQGERQALFDEYGIEAPAGHPGEGPRGPGGRGPGGHPGPGQR